MNSYVLIGALGVRGRKQSSSGDVVVWQLSGLFGWNETLEFLKIVFWRLRKFGAKSNLLLPYGLSLRVCLGLWPFLIFTVTGRQQWCRIFSFDVAVCFFGFFLLIDSWWITDPLGCNLYWFFAFDVLLVLFYLYSNLFLIKKYIYNVTYQFTYTYILSIDIFLAMYMFHNMVFCIIYFNKLRM